MPEVAEGEEERRLDAEEETQQLGQAQIDDEAA